MRLGAGAQALRGIRLPEPPRLPVPVRAGPGRARFSRAFQVGLADRAAQRAGVLRWGRADPLIPMTSSYRYLSGLCPRGPGAAAASARADRRRLGIRAQPAPQPRRSLGRTGPAFPGPETVVAGAGPARAEQRSRRRS